MTFRSDDPVLSEILATHEMVGAAHLSLPEAWRPLLALAPNDAGRAIAERIGLDAEHEAAAMLASAIHVGVLVPKRKRAKDRDARLALFVTARHAVLFRPPEESSARFSEGYNRVLTTLGPCEPSQVSGRMLSRSELDEACDYVRERVENNDGTIGAITAFYDHGTGDYDFWLDGEWDQAYWLDHETGEYEPSHRGGFASWLGHYLVKDTRTLRE